MQVDPIEAAQSIRDTYVPCLTTTFSLRDPVLLSSSTIRVF